MIASLRRRAIKLKKRIIKSRRKTRKVNRLAAEAPPQIILIQRKRAVPQILQKGSTLIMNAIWFSTKVVETKKGLNKLMKRSPKKKFLKHIPDTDIEEKISGLNSVPSNFL